jgi:ribosomal protein S18 acetylase RimI-like enzyme
MIADSGQLQRQALPIPRIAIRAVDPNDIEAIAQIITHSFEFDRGLLGWFAPLFRYGIAEDLRHRLKSSSEGIGRGEQPQHACLVAIYPIDGKSTVVGTVELSIRKRIDRSTRTEYVYVSNLAVSAAFRQRGIGLELLDGCECIAQSWEQENLYLHVMADNSPGRNLYHKAGYTVMGEDRIWSLAFWNRPRRLFLHKSIN